MLHKVTFTVEVGFDRPIEPNQRRYICASIEEGILNLWHDYMVNEAVAPQQPMTADVRCRCARATLT